MPDCAGTHYLSLHNVSDHRAGTSNLNSNSHAPGRLRVHRIVMPRRVLCGAVPSCDLELRI